MSFKYFEFTSWQLTSSEKLEVKVFVVHPWVTVLADLGSRIDDVLRERRPDAILIIVPYEKIDDYIEGARTVDEFIEAFERAEGIIVNISIATFGGPSSALLGNLQTLLGEPLDFLDDPDVQANIWHEGAKFLVTSRGAIKTAPPGCIFEKPSGRLSEIFIRAQNLLYSEPEIGFLCIYLLRLFRENDLKPEIIYVDTMAIYSLGLALARILSISQEHPRVESFSSYEGLESFDPNPSEAAIYLLSASTSGSLAKKLREKYNIEVSTIFTLIDVADSRTSSKIVMPLGGVRERTDIAKDDPSLISAARIPITGEFFSTTPSGAREVLISLRHSKKSDCNFWYERNQQCPGQVLANYHLGATTLASMGKEKILKDPKFNKWWKLQIRANFPVSARHIVTCSADEQDMAFAELVKGYVKDELSGPDVTVSSIDKLEASSPKSIVIVALGGSDIFRIINTSRELRDKAPNADRLFILGPLLARTAIQIERTLSDIELSPREHTYQVICFAKLAVGLAADVSSWEAERQLWERLEATNDGFGAADDLIANRLTTLSHRVIQEPFLPSPRRERLKLSPSFAFWGSKYNPENIDNLSVLFTIADVLQSARELDFPRREDILRSLAHEPVVISPRVFDRFSDGLVQAALLRAAHPTELRYDLDDHQSEQVTELICDLIRHCDARRGEAALEFSLALATNRMRVTTKDLEKLRSAAKDAPLLKKLFVKLMWEAG